MAQRSCFDTVGDIAVQHANPTHSGMVRDTHTANVVVHLGRYLTSTTSAMSTANRVSPHSHTLDDLLVLIGSFVARSGIVIVPVDICAGFFVLEEHEGEVRVRDSSWRTHVVLL